METSGQQAAQAPAQTHQGGQNVELKAMDHRPIAEQVLLAGCQQGLDGDEGNSATAPPR
jgi:hypothetical protein